ncbi:hypothetical protein [Flavicella sp.]|uniref:hypothetical protein n=1 Tax=Flavicella sp. TaxID=2957742 RepID=UPI0030167AAC
MKSKSNIRKVTFLIILLNCLFISCTYNTEEATDKTSKTLPNGKYLVVEKITKASSSWGVLTNHYYGTYSYKYKISIPQEDINWNGGSGEPKNILFCKDTTYIRYLKKRL